MNASRFPSAAAASSHTAGRAGVSAGTGASSSAGVMVRAAPGHGSHGQGPPQGHHSSASRAHSAAGGAGASRGKQHFFRGNMDARFVRVMHEEASSFNSTYRKAGQLGSGTYGKVELFKTNRSEKVAVKTSLIPIVPGALPIAAVSVTQGIMVSMCREFSIL